MSDSEDPIEPIDEGGDDLFGDEGDEGSEAVASPKERILEDDDLASDAEGDTYARYRDEDQARDQDEIRERIVVDVTAYRHPVPKPSDGVVSLLPVPIIPLAVLYVTNFFALQKLRALRVPKFVRFQPEEFNSDTFEPSELDIANAKAEHPQHVARFRKDASTGRLQSNTNILRWSDGSITISIGGEQYEITKKPLAPAPNKPYNELNDAHYYAAAAELSSNMLMTVGHITEQYTIRPNKEVGDDALNLFTDRMAQATKTAGTNEMIIRTTVDPELQKKKAEQLEKERMKAQRRRENAQARQDFGLGRPGRGGLSIGALEGGRRDRKRGAAGAKPKRRRPEYDSDDDLPQGVGRQEKYDLDDGFLVGSDEEEEELESEADDDDDLLDDDDEAPRSKRQRTTEADEDASGDEVDAAPETSGRARRRNVIEDDEE